MILPLLASDPANAQNQAIVRRLIEINDPKYESLHRITLNIVNMLAGGLNGDTNAVESVKESLNSINDFISAWSALYTVSTIYVAMIDARDIKIVQSHFALDCKSLKKNAEVAQAKLNRQIGGLKLDAVRSEVVIARDIIADMAQQVPCK